MKLALQNTIVLTAIFVAPAILAVDAGAHSVEVRKREYASLQKDLEAARPADDASKEEMVAYLELSKDSYEKFAKAHPKTPEGFEAAASIAGLLTQYRHPEALKFSELAADSAPAAGVEIQRVALCWVWIVQGRLEKLDADGAMAALEKVKSLSKPLYDRISAEVEGAIKKINQDKDLASKLKPGNEAFQIAAKDIRGRDFSLEGLRGSVVIVHFWSPAHISELQNLGDLHKMWRARGLEIVGISLDQDETELKDAVRDNEVKWTVLSDHKGWDSQFAQKWGILSLPRNYLIDRKGIIRYVNLKDEQLSAAVKKLLNEDK
jgi:peroxiredoxin